MTDSLGTFGSGPDCRSESRSKTRFRERSLHRAPDFRFWPISGLSQCNLTALDYGGRIGRHENRNSQVPGDSHISSGGEFGTLGEW